MIANEQIRIQIVDTPDSLENSASIGFPTCRHQINRTLLIISTKKDVQTVELAASRSSCQ